MYFIVMLALVGQADDILADEAKKGTPSAATAPADVAPAPVMPAKVTGENTAGDKAAGDKAPATAAQAADKSGKEDDSAKAQGEDAEAEKKAEAGGFSKVLSDISKTGALGYMLAGGIFMWPILLMGILALGVIIERYRALLMLSSRNDALRDEVRGLLQADKVEQALEMCDRQQGPVPAILGAGLRKYLVTRRLGYDAAKIEEQVVKGMDDYSVHIVAALERHLPILATVSSAAPMIGFLGTVQGMVRSFDDIVLHMGEQNIVEAAAAGIKVSLLTTVLGLVVGIPAFVAFNYFTSVINRFVLDVEESAADLIEAVTLQLALAGKQE